MWRQRCLELGNLSKEVLRVIFVHEGEHEVPGSKSKDAMTNAVHAI